MVEFPLTGWTSEQREGLAFLLDDAEIAATWAVNSVAVPEESAPRVERFIAFLEAPAAATSTTAVADRTRAGAGWNEPDMPPLAFTDDLGISGIASPGLRLAGALVDSFVLCPVAGFVLLATSGDGAWLVSALTALYLVVAVGRFGRTLGSAAVRTRVIPLDGAEVPGVRAAFVRWLVPVLPGLAAVVWSWAGVVAGVWTLVVFAPILSGPSHRGLHDRAAKVAVVDEREYHRAKPDRAGDATTP